VARPTYGPPNHLRRLRRMGDKRAEGREGKEGGKKEDRPRVVRSSSKGLFFYNERRNGGERGGEKERKKGIHLVGNHVIPVFYCFPEKDRPRSRPKRKRKGRKKKKGEKGEELSSKCYRRFFAVLLFLTRPVLRGKEEKRRGGERRKEGNSASLTSRSAYVLSDDIARAMLIRRRKKRNLGGACWNAASKEKRGGEKEKCPLRGRRGTHLLIFPCAQRPRGRGGGKNRGFEREEGKKSARYQLSRSRLLLSVLG